MDNDKKRELSQKIAPQIKSLIKQYGYDAVAYTWTKTVETQRKISRAEAEAEEAQKKVDALKQKLLED